MDDERWTKVFGKDIVNKIREMWPELGRVIHFTFNGVNVYMIVVLENNDRVNQLDKERSDTWRIGQSLWSTKAMTSVLTHMESRG